MAQEHADNIIEHDFTQKSEFVDSNSNKPTREELERYDLVTLRKMSKGKFSGGYSMKKADLITALIEHA